MNEPIMTEKSNLASLFLPESIAIVGASADLHRFGGIPVRLTRQYGFKGPIYPVNPNHEEIAGLKCYPNVDSLPHTPEFVMFCTPREQTLAAMQQCAERGVRAAAVTTSGFAETGAEGAAFQEEMVEIARSANMRLLGPNCMGVVHVRSGLMATFTISIRDDDPLIPGSVALVTQSGALGACMLTGFQETGTGISALVSLGNESDIDFTECIEYFLDDPDTRVICGYLESIRDGVRFRAAAERALEVGKPIVLLKAGTTEAGARAAMSHTAALTTPQHVFEAFARQFGILTCDSFSELIETAEFLSRSKPLLGNRLGILSFSGGAGSLAADLASQSGFILPELGESTQESLKKILSEYAAVGNPVDLVSLMVSRPNERPLQEAGRAVYFDPAMDAVCLIMGVYHHVGSQVAEDLAALFRKSPLPFACTWLTGPQGDIMELRKAGIPVFEDYSRAIRALESLLQISQATARIRKIPKEPDEARRESARKLLRNSDLSDQGMLPIQSCLALLDLYEIPRPEDAIADSPEAALSAWEAIRGPVALKVISNQLIHKTEIGGVITGLHSADDIRAAAERLLTLAPDARVQIQKMMEGSVELIAGISHDPPFGHCVTAGLGGVFVEVLQDVTRRLPPFDSQEAAEMLRSLRGAKVLEGVRGKPAVHLSAASNVLSRLSEMAVEMKEEIAELDINPLIVTPKEALAVDVRVRLL
jgi:acetyltransferase